jgi:hypothetical protein
MAFGAGVYTIVSRLGHWQADKWFIQKGFLAFRFVMALKEVLLILSWLHLGSIWQPAPFPLLFLPFIVSSVKEGSFPDIHRESVVTCDFSYLTKELAWLSWEAGGFLIWHCTTKRNHCKVTRSKDPQLYRGRFVF